MFFSYRSEASEDRLLGRVVGEGWRRQGQASATCCLARCDAAVVLRVRVPSGGGGGRSNGSRVYVLESVFWAVKVGGFQKLRRLLKALLVREHATEEDSKTMMWEK